MPCNRIVVIVGWSFSWCRWRFSEVRWWKDDGLKWCNCKRLWHCAKNRKNAPENLSCHCIGFETGV